jgi:hypothetical protein
MAKYLKSMSTRSFDALMVFSFLKLFVEALTRSATYEENISSYYLIDAL